MDKKQINVGILTFHYVLNPGSALQAYALCRTVNSLDTNIKCCVINYQKKDYLWNRSFPPNSKFHIGMAFYIYTGLSLLFFQRFEKQFIPQNTTRKVKRNQLQKLSNQYDFFIVGSDQIWNTQSLPHEVDDTYFLDFCKDKRKKISYAASIGLPDFPENDKLKVTDYLNDFKCLSVREPQAQDVIERLIGRRPALVVDPTLLLNCKMWEELAIKPSMDSYVFLYLRHKNSEVVPYAKALANKLGLKIVEYHSGIRKIYSDDKLLIHPEPRKWLGWLLNAKYVFTDSFHGSILYQL